MTRRERILDELRVQPGSSAAIAERDPGWTGGPDYEGLTHDGSRTRPGRYSRGSRAALLGAGAALGERHPRALVVFQAMDAAGKDSAIKHVMSGVNPQGVQVFSFKTAVGRGARSRLPLADREGAPERGRIGIFNRSHYEEVVALRVHPEWLEQAAAARGTRRARGSGRSATRTSTRSSVTSTATGRRS